MGKAKLVFEKGPLSFSANVTIIGNQLVEPDAATGRIKPAAALSELCLGVAMGDASATGFANADTVDAWGNNITNMHYPPNEVAVAYQGVFRLKVASATATVPFGALVKCAANGEVQLHSQTAAATFPMIVGRCVEPGGIAAAAEGKILIGGMF